MVFMQELKENAALGVPEDEAVSDAILGLQNASFSLTKFRVASTGPVEIGSAVLKQPKLLRGSSLQAIDEIRLQRSKNDASTSDSNRTSFTSLAGEGSVAQMILKSSVEALKKPHAVPTRAAQKPHGLLLPLSVTGDSSTGSCGGSSIPSPSTKKLPKQSRTRSRSHGTAPCYSEHMKAQSFNSEGDRSSTSNSHKGARFEHMHELLAVMPNGASAVASVSQRGGLSVYGNICSSGESILFIPHRQESFKVTADNVRSLRIYEFGIKCIVPPEYQSSGLLPSVARMPSKSFDGGLQ